MDKHDASKVFCSEDDFLLGLSDLTGELMRWGINCVGSAGLGVDASVSSVKLAQSWIREMLISWSRIFARKVVKLITDLVTDMRPLGVNVRGLYAKLNVMDNSLVKLEKGAYDHLFST